ncbi:hypothetical protein [Shewanella sp. cp20]|uniref:hypothetical protein n=1 Tax=Shewanella sp. cp20 TaxID=1521167 RepID=UPI001F3F45A9|nr:hypothetical protein [Shewanella sp. cp20]
MMNLNVTLWGQILFVVALIVIFFTVRFAQGKASNVPLVGFYALLLNLLIPPGGWIYCGYWYFKKS